MLSNDADWLERPVCACGLLIPVVDSLSSAEVIAICRYPPCPITRYGRALTPVCVCKTRTSVSLRQSILKICSFRLGARGIIVVKVLINATFRKAVGSRPDEVNFFKFSKSFWPH
jgi:hypothetical protein